MFDQVASGIIANVLTMLGKRGVKDSSTMFRRLATAVRAKRNDLLFVPDAAVITANDAAERFLRDADDWRVQHCKLRLRMR